MECHHPFELIPGLGCLLMEPKRRNTLTETQNQCREKGGELFEFTNFAQQQSLLYDFVTKKGSKRTRIVYFVINLSIFLIEFSVDSSSSSNSFWVGLRKSTHNHKWYCRRSGKQLHHDKIEKNKSKAWQSARPNGEGPCALLWMRAHKTDLIGSIYDTSCTNRNTDFLFCEIPYVL